MHNCKGCGQCCKVLIISDKQWNKKRIADDPDLLWAHKHLTKITRAAAIKLNPHIKNITKIGFYKCDYFDYNTNTCKGYDDRRWMCTAYPFYGDSVVDCSNHPHTPDCYYSNQVMVCGV